jgi:MFS transporter, FSR family, fosmidomycin resistance protein
MMQRTSKKSLFVIATSSHAVTDLYSSFIIGLIPILAIKFSLSLFMISILTSTASISNSLTQPVFGYLSDKYGVRYFLLAGPLFSSILISLIPVLPSYYLVIIFLFLGNLSISAFHPSNAAMSGYYGGKRKGLMSSMIFFSGTIGYSLGSIFIILIIEKIGINYSPVAMIPGIVMALITIKFLSAFSQVQIKKSTSNLFQKIRSLNKIKMLLFAIVFIVSFARDLLWLSLITFMPIYFTNLKISLTNTGYIIMLFNFVGAFGGLLAGFYWDRIRHKTYLLQAGLFLSLPFLYFTFKIQGLISIVFFVIGGFFIISTLPLCIRISQDIFPSNISLASALVMGLSAGGASLVIIGLGKIADYIGIIKVINYILILPFIVSLLLFLFPYLYNLHNSKHVKIQKELI